MSYHSTPGVSEGASYVAYTSTASAMTFWGLHVSDAAVIVSAIAAVCCAVIQVLSYLDRRTTSRRGEETDDDGAGEAH